jgi:hypothetical protein
VDVTETVIAIGESTAAVDWGPADESWPKRPLRKLACRLTLWRRLWPCDIIFRRERKKVEERNVGV